MHTRRPPRSRSLRCALAAGFACVLVAGAACSTNKPDNPTTTASKARSIDRPGIEIPASIERALAARDRTDTDRKLDAGRKPAETLTFFEIDEGSRVAELGAGTGYTAELLARIVGSSGKVYAHNPPFVIERFGDLWVARLERPALKDIIRVDRGWDDPLPADARNLDTVLNILFYHDTVWMNADRAAMNRAVYAALRPGGVYGIVDHSARAGAGLSEVRTLHRIEQGVLVEEILAAGFVLDAEADFLRNPADGRDWNAAPGASGDRRGTSDRFVLKFRKN